MSQVASQRADGPSHMLRGTVAAAFTPLARGGDAVDFDAIGPYVDYLEEGGIDAVLALGSNGEGILLEPSERRAVAERYREATADRLMLAVHVGALTTGLSAALAEHARSIGADAVAAIAPPYYSYTEDELVEHFALIADACAPVPFYLYEFEARSGYTIPVRALERVRERCPNLRGIKVSDSPFSAVAPYMLEGIDLFVGFDPLIPEGLASGAAGAVSGLAAIVPHFVSDLVRAPSKDKAGRAAERISGLGACFIQRGKMELAEQGLMRPDVRRPLLAGS